MKQSQVSLDYFKKGDYSEWYNEEIKNGFKGTYEEYIENKLIPEMKEYDALILYNDGTLYGVKKGIEYGVSYIEFDPILEPHLFYEIAQEFGIS